MEKLGVARAVLARELTFEEIKNLSLKSKIGLEVFVFGAMCYSASGFCYASLLTSNRSGNRGICSQVCRTKFNNETPFSMKDLNLIEEAEKLVKSGVNSLKIEGRMKGADYVYFATKSLKILKSGNFSQESKKECKKLISSIFMRETGIGYFYGLDKDIFTKEKHSLQKTAGTVEYLKGNILKLNNKIKLSVGSRIKINNKGATVIGFENNSIVLSTVLKGKKGDIAELFPNKTSIKGVQGQINAFENTKIPVSITAKAKVEKTFLIFTAYLQKKSILKRKYQIETIISENKGLTKEIFLKKIASPHYKITDFAINQNNLSVKPQIFKQIKKELTKKLEKKENLIKSGNCTLCKNYKTLNYLQKTVNGTILPPIYYSKLNIKPTDTTIINNIGQLNYNNKRKIAGKFLPVTNKVSAYVLTQLGVNDFLIPYELKQDNTTPYFVVRKLPNNLPKNFYVQKIGDCFLITSCNLNKQHKK
jgi:putative protease